MEIDISPLERGMHETHEMLEGFIEKARGQLTEFSDRLTELEQKNAAEAIGDGASHIRTDPARVVKSLLKDKQLDGAEAEFHEEFIRKTGIDLPGVRWLNIKAFDYGSESPTSGGSNLVAQNLSAPISLLRQNSVIERMGPTKIQTVGNLEYPRQSTGLTTYLFAADGDAITQSEPAWSLLSIPWKAFGAYGKANYRTLMQSDGVAARVMFDDIVQGIGEKFDEQAIQGNGSGSNLTGITNQAGVNTSTWAASPAAIAWADLMDCEYQLAADKALKGNLAFLVDPLTWKAMRTTTKVSSDAGAGFLLDFEGNGPVVGGYPCYQSVHVPSNTVIFADWSQLIVAEYGALGLATDETTDFASGGVGFRGIYPANVGLARPTAFCVSTP